MLQAFGFELTKISQSVSIIRNFGYFKNECKLCIYEILKEFSDVGIQELDQKNVQLQSWPSG